MNNEFGRAVGMRAVGMAGGNSALTVLYVKRMARAYIESDMYARKGDIP